MSLRIKDGIEALFDAEKPHFLQWIRVGGYIDGDEPWRDGGIQHEATPIYFAAFCGHSDVLEKLMREHLEHVNSGGGPIGTPLHAASLMDNQKVIQSLLAHGADVNAPDVFGTPLLFASHLGHLEVVRLLLERGADVNAKTDTDLTSLHMAARSGHYEVVRTLLKHNADTNARDDAGYTPLYIATDNGYTDIVRLLLNDGTDPNVHSTKEKTLLLAATLAERLDIVRLLLEHGAEVNGRTESGVTAYDMASYRRPECKVNYELVQLLLAHGAKSMVAVGRGCY